MKRFVLIISLFNFIYLTSEGQNLIVNPGFEEIDSTNFSPKSDDVYSDFGIKGWFNPTLRTPDCFIIGKSIVYNSSDEILRDDIKAHSGISFSGFFPFCDIPQQPREYIGGSLTKALDSGMIYKFSAQIAMRMFDSNYWLDTIGIYFSESEMHINTESIITNVKPQLKICIKNTCAQADIWEEISGYFKATGRERFFVIGNFQIPKSKKNEPKLQPDPQDGHYHVRTDKIILVSYYFIDDFSLVSSSQKEMMAARDLHSKIGVGKKLIATDIYFASGDSTIKAESFASLNGIIAEMKVQSKLKVQINGHTDNTGTPEKNQSLSEARARAVANYFITHGIAAGRIRSKGYGSSKPIGSDQNKNRRVEFIFE